MFIYNSLIFRPSANVSKQQSNTNTLDNQNMLSVNNKNGNSNVYRLVQSDREKVYQVQIFQAIILFLTFLVSVYYRLPVDIIGKEYCSAKAGEEEADEALEKADRKMAQLTGKSVPDFMQPMYFEMVSKTIRRTHTDMMRFESVSIIYADVVGFTKLSTILQTKTLFEALNDLFSTFDELAKKYRLLRVRILGDAYYAVCGLPNPVAIPYPKHASHTLLMGIEMAKEMVKFKERKDFGSTIQSSMVHGVDYDLTEISMRIGIHSGPVMCGLFGKHKLQFDIFGSDVTITEHLESSGKKLMVHISEAARDCIEEDNHFCPALKQLQFNPNNERNDEFLDEKMINSYLVNPFNLPESLNKFIADPDFGRFSAFPPRFGLRHGDARRGSSFNKLSDKIKKFGIKPITVFKFKFIEGDLGNFNHHERNTKNAYGTDLEREPLKFSKSCTNFTHHQGSDTPMSVMSSQGGQHADRDSSHNTPHTGKRSILSSQGKSKSKFLDLMPFNRASSNLNKKEAQSNNIITGGRAQIQNVSIEKPVTSPEKSVRTSRTSSNHSVGTEFSDDSRCDDNESQYTDSNSSYYNRSTRCSETYFTTLMNQIENRRKFNKQRDDIYFFVPLVLIKTHLTVGFFVYAILVIFIVIVYCFGLYLSQNQGYSRLSSFSQNFLNVEGNFIADNSTSNIKGRFFF